MKIFKNLDLKDLESEIWKTIEDFPDYQVSNLGRVKSLKFRKERVLKQQKRGKYLFVILCKNGEYKKYIHRLIFETFNNYKLKSDEDVHHIDEEPENNIFENLVVMPKSEHHSFHNKGERHPFFGKHHSEESKKKMSEKLKGKFSGENNPNFGKISTFFGKHHTTESKKKQSEIKKEIYVGENNPNSILIEKSVIEIWKYLNSGIFSQKEVGKKFCVDQTTISNIKTGKTWYYLYLIYNKKGGDNNGNDYIS